MLKITLVGYGKMGKAIEEEALKRGHTIYKRIDIDNQDEWNHISPENTDVIIEFTHPHAFHHNLQHGLKAGLPIVSGTTGWHNELDKVGEMVREKNGSFIYSSNFSIGVNILFLLNRQLAKLMNVYPQYDTFIEERHHRHKADAPSGTAMSLAKQVLEGLERKTRIATDALQSRPPAADELSVGYIRSGEIIGHHKVVYTSEIDSLTIEHHAHNRKGFALGAVVAAEWIIGKTGLYEFAEVFR